MTPLQKFHCELQAMLKGGRHTTIGEIIAYTREPESAILEKVDGLLHLRFIEYINDERTLIKLTETGELARHMD